MPSRLIDHCRSESCTLTTGKWSAPDDGGTSDSNGIGFSKGSGSSDDDAAIWFDIKVKDQSGGFGDGDGLSHRAERSYGSDPEVKDSDGDGLDDRWEVVYGLDPNDGTTDLTDDESDNDAIELIDEYTYGGIPGQKDIFVEVDWMGDPGATHVGEDKFSEVAIAMVVRPFAIKNIALHIDDSSVSSTDAKYMGGGKEINHDDETTRNEFVGTCPNCFDTNDVNTIYGREFTDNRQGIFHYAVFGHKTDISYVGGYSTGDAIWISDSEYEGILGGAKEEEQARAFMHELGHQFNLNADGLVASDSRDSYGYPNDPIDDDLYPSSMRYYAEKGDNGYIDYSSRPGEITDLWYYDLEYSIFNSGYNLPNTDDWSTVKKNLGWKL